MVFISADGDNSSGSKFEDISIKYSSSETNMLRVALWDFIYLITLSRISSL